MSTRSNTASGQAVFGSVLLTFGNYFSKENINSTKSPRQLLISRPFRLLRAPAA